MNKFLITTADERTWPEQQHELIFLGEWCKIYSRKENWLKYKSHTLNYHWNNTAKFNKDFDYLKKLQKKLLLSVSNSLNELHRTNFSNKYWEILIGEFIMLVVQVIFDRWENIKNLEDKNIEINSIRLSYDDNSLVTNDLWELQLLSSTNDSWNSGLYSMIIDEFIKNKSIKINQIDGTDKITPPIYFNKSLINIKHYILKFYQKIVGFFFNKNQPLIINSYLNYFDDLLINLKYKRLPLFINLEKPINLGEYDVGYRNWKISFEPNNQFEEFLIKVIPVIMPKSYLEGFRKISLKAESSNFPQNPKFIFTSNITSDELLKNYIASKIEKGSKLICGQHGGGYGLAKLSSHEDHEISISDRYLSWGWHDIKRKKIFPLGMIKKSHIKKKINTNNLTLVLNANARYGNFLWSNVISSQWLLYFNDQCSFISKLNNNIKDNLYVKMYHSDYDWGQSNRLISFSKSIKFHPESVNLKKAFQNSRIIVSTHNSTTFLESIYFNIPTVIFWDIKISPLRDSVNSIFNDLEKVGIFHKSPESAAIHINKVWQNVDKWWGSPEVILVMSKFKDEYCKSDFSFKKLKEALSM